MHTGATSADTRAILGRPGRSHRPASEGSFVLLRRWLCLGGLAVALAPLPSPLRGQGSPTGPRVMSRVLSAPTPFPANGSTHWEYELHVTNLTGPPFALTRVDVLTGDGRPLATYAGEALRTNVVQPGALQRALGVPSRTPAYFERRMAWQSTYDPTRIEPGTLGVIYVRLALDKVDPVPRVIRHQLTIEYEDPERGLTESVIDADATIPRQPALTLGPPLRGGPWWVYNRTDSAAHNRSLGAFGEIFQRFAIDYNKVDEFGHTFAGDRFVLENNLSFGADVLAVADGVVVSAEGGVAEGEVGRRVAGVGARGNYVDLAVGDGIYAVYMHLQAGSVTVQPGDSVRRGQVIGRIGQTGASQAPHLHFHVYEASWREGSDHEVLGRQEGVPYVHPTFEVLGEGVDPLGTWIWPSPYCDCTGAGCEPRPTERREGEMPKGDLVIRFPDDRGGDGPRVEDDTDQVMAICHVREARLLTDQFLISDAIATLETAQDLYGNLRVSDLEWRALCWQGSIAGEAGQVLFACDAAVAAEPTFGAHLSARGVARALSGDTPGAIEDLEAYLEWQARHEGRALFTAREDGLSADSGESLRAQVRGWIDSLVLGENPFTAEFLLELRNGG